MMPRTVSAGVVVTDGNSLLLCHVTGAKHWDLPKGKIDLGEEPITAAVRELREETGLIVDPVSLVDLGRFAYKKNKDLHLCSTWSRSYLIRGHWIASACLTMARVP